MTKSKSNDSKRNSKTLASVPGFFGACVAPGEQLVWENEVEEFCLNLNAAALGAEVQLGRSTLFVEAKDQKTALCSLTPSSNEQWNLTQTFTSFDGPIVFSCEGVNAIHLTGFVDIQEEDEDENENDEDDEDEEGYGCCDDEECEGCEVDEDGEPLYVDGHEVEDDEDSEEVDEDTLMFGVDSDSEEEDEEGEQEDNGRFEVIEERVHGDVAEKKEKKSPKQEETKKTENKKSPAKDKKPVETEDKKKTATPKKQDPKTATPQKKTPQKKEPTPAKKTPAADKKDKEVDTKASTPAKTAKSPAKSAQKEKSTTPAATKESAKKQKDDAAKSPATTTPASSKKRALASESVDVPKKAKTSKMIKGVSVVEHAVGKGAPVQRGKKVSILYRGRLENGKQFDAAQNRKRPFTFRHGIGDVIKGMDFGIEGMRAGGKRTITIPSQLGYGRSGAPPTIPGNATLIFDIEML